LKNADGSAMDWNAWKTSITPTAYQKFGSGGFKASPSWDVVVDMCEEPHPPSITPNGSTIYGTGGGGTSLMNETPPEDMSYMSYDMKVIPSRTRPVSRQAVLQEPDYETEASESESTFWFPPTPGVADIIQTGGAARYAFRLVGSAVRAGHEIVRPRLTQINGKAVAEAVAHFSLDVIGNNLGVPVFGAHWLVDYVLSDSPESASTDPREDPMECITGTNNGNAPGGDGGGGGDVDVVLEREDWHPDGQPAPAGDG